jgi:uncharacterized membrane protein YsdA (DUF1294 family)
MIYRIPLLYLVMINAVTFLAMWWDKRKAVRNQWRVAEVTLQLLGIIGGAIGILSGMYKLRYKTKKMSFLAVAVVGLIISLIIYWIVGIQYI